MRPPASRAQGRAVYLLLLFLVPATASFGHYVAPGRPVIFGQDFGIVAGGLCALAAVLPWLVFRGRRPWPVPVHVFLFLVLILWMYQILRMRSDAMAFNYMAFIVPLAIAMIWLKSVGRLDLKLALLVLGYSLVAIAVLSLIAGETGLLPSGFDVSDGGGQTRFFWLDALGIETRWGGPWTSVNRASAMGGLLLVIGALQRSWHRVILMSIGAGVLMLGGSRAALMAAVVALLIVLLTQGRINDMRHKTVIRVGTVCGLVFLFVLYITFFDPTLALRTPIWSYFLDFVPRSGLFGVGESGVNEYVSSLSQDPDFLAHTDPHNIYLDWLVRYGWLMLGLSMAALAVAVGVAAKALSRGIAAPMALLSYVVIYGIADTILSWIYWSAFLAVVVWGVLFAAVSTQVPRSLKDPKSVDR